MVHVEFSRSILCESSSAMSVAAKKGASFAATDSELEFPWLLCLVIQDMATSDSGGKDVRLSAERWPRAEKGTEPIDTAGEFYVIGIAAEASSCSIDDCGIPCPGVLA